MASSHNKWGDSTFILPWLFAFITFSALSDPAVLRVNDNDWPPYFFGGKEGPPKGIGKEILHHCLADNGYQFNFSFYPINRMHKYMELGELDINIYSYKPERESFLLYGTEPLFVAGYRPIVRKNESRKISSIEDFEPLLMGHVHGLSYSDGFYQYVKERQKNGQLVTTSDSGTLLTLLVNNRVDVFVATSETALWQAKLLGFKEQIKVLDYDIKTSNYFVTISKYSPRIENKVEFLNQLDTCIRNAKKSGFYQSIIDKYRL